MKNEQTKTTIFTIIDVSKPIEKQKRLIEYSLEIAKKLDKKLIFYPKTSTISFDAARTFLFSLFSNTSNNVSVSKNRINPLNFFTSMCDIAKKEAAELIIVGVTKDQSKSWRKEIFMANKNSLISILLVPDETHFVDIHNIVIPVDSSLKIQKINEAIKLAKIFESKITIFKENIPQNKNIDIVTNQTKKYLLAANISFAVVLAEEEKEFIKNMCKYASKHAQLLLIEINPGKIDDTTKKNISKLMSLDTYVASIPVWINKTKNTMISIGKW